MSKVHVLLLLLAMAGQAAAEDVVKESGAGSINWSKGIIYAQGFGTSKPELPAPQRRLLARRAAIVDGQRNLLEITKGVQLTSLTKVVDAMVESSVIATRVEGVLKGAAPVKEAYQNEIYTVTMAMPIGGELLTAIYQEPEQLLGRNRSGKADWVAFLHRQLEPSYTILEAFLIPRAQAAEPFLIENDEDLDATRRIIEWISNEKPSDISGGLSQAMSNYQSGQFSGLLIDASNIASFELATIPKIRSEDGTVIYPSESTSYDDIMNKRGVSYDFDMNDAIRNQRVAKIPFVIRATSTYKHLASDLIIPKADADKIIGSASIRNAMNKAGVMIVVKI